MKRRQGKGIRCRQLVSAFLILTGQQHPIRKERFEKRQRRVQGVVHGKVRRGMEIHYVAALALRAANYI
ncbi:hypothetical protein PS3A_57590 [Pseudomonas sp. 3A(2025)]